MIHDPELLDRLDSFPKESFAGRVYRATRKNQNPLLASRSGGRWMASASTSVLYTSLEREGALAEICFHWAQWNPRPSKPATIHTLQVSASRTLRFVRADLEALGIADHEYSLINLPRTQEIGAAVDFLGCDGLIAPCARWPCDNLIVFPENASFHGRLAAVTVEDVDWQAWGEANGVFEP